MLPPLRVVVLSLCSTAAAACGFDSDGLATGSNSAGTLESTGGGESSTADDGPATTMPTTSPTGPSTLTSGSEDGSSTTPPSTTQEPTESSGGATESTGAEGSEASSGDESRSSSSEDATTSTDSGSTSAPYGACDDGADCDGGACVTLYLDYEERLVCYPPCEEAPECPVPESGEAVPVCTDSGCGLDCDAEGGGPGTVPCPDGMVCGYTGKGYRRCLWP